MERSKEASDGALGSWAAARFRGQVDALKPANPFDFKSLTLKAAEQTD
jgi:hypothetical protein